MRFDIANGKKTETWFVTIDKGDLSVSRSGGAADSTLVASKALFDRLASGKASAVAEVLRGTLRSRATGGCSSSSVESSAHRPLSRRPPSRARARGPEGDDDERRTGQDP